MRDGTGKYVNVSKELQWVDDENTCNIVAMALVTRTSFTDMHMRFEVKGRKRGDRFGIRYMVEIIREMGYRPKRIARSDFQKSIHILRDEYGLDEPLTVKTMAAFPKAFRHWGRRVLIWDGDTTFAYVDGKFDTTSCGYDSTVEKAYRVA